jgi:protein phosphatase PTC7
LLLLLQIATGGEDAWFVSSAGAGSIGVADGVGGWRESGIDAGGEDLP